MVEESSRDARQDLVEEYRSYVAALTRALLRSMSLSQDLFEELEAAGLLGLVEAAQRFDFDGGADFKSFAYLRIRGSIIDAVRRLSDLSGKAYRYAKALQAAHEIRDRFYAEGDTLSGKSKRDAETTLATAFEYAARGALAYRLSFADFEKDIRGESLEHLGAEHLLEKRDELEKLRTALATLPAKERLVVEEYYFNDKPFTQIADENEGMSKSWVSRLHTRALQSLQGVLAEERPVTT